MDLTKNTTIGGRHYAIGRIPAEDGCWIAWKFMVGALSLGQPDFRSIQAILLTYCTRLEPPSNVPVPIYAPSAGILPADLKYDVATIAKLTREALIFNVINPFFGDPELAKTVDELQRGFTSPITRHSTHTSGDQSPQASGNTPI